MASSAAQLGTHRRELTPYSRITLGGLEQTKLPTALRQRHLSILDAETRHLLDPAELWSTAEPTITTSAALLELPCPHPTDLEVLKFVDFPGADYKSLQWQSHLVDITVAPRIWTELISLRDVQTKWLDSLQWLEGRIKRGGDVGRLAALVLEDMRGLKWDEKLKGFADVPGVLTLCRLLGPSSYAHWADGTIINSLLETHQRNAALLAPLQSPSRLSNSSLFAASPFTPAGGHSYALSVENFTHPGRLHRAPWFKRLQAAVTADPLLQIFVPLFVGTDHWALARFDIANNAWSFADSMPGHSTAYLNKARAACGLISEALGYASSSSDDLLPIGSQSDGASCGFFVMDAFVHAVTGAPLAKQSSVDTLRLRGAALLFEESRCSAARQTLDLDSPSPSSSPLSSPIQPSFANAAASSHPFPSDELAPPLQSSDNPPLDGANPSYFDSFEQPIFERIASSSLAQMEAALAIKSDAPFAGFESSDSDSEDINGYESDTSGSSSDSDGGHPDDPEGRKLLAILADANRAEKAAGTEEDQSSVPLQPNLPLHPPLRLQPPPPLSKTKTAKGSAKGDKTRQAISEDKVVARLAADRKAAKAHPLEYQRWRTKILEKDRKVTFDPRRPRFARCGSCHVEKAAKEMFESQRIIDHVTTCPKKNVSAGPMDAFLQRRPAPPLLSKSPATPVLSLVRAGIYPCTGLTKEQHSRIPDYLGTGARGGGGRARQAILVDLFGLEEVAVRKKLKIRKQDRWTSAERRMADTREELEFTWINDHRAQAVRSASCLRTAIVDHPCANCISLLANPRFQRALNRQLTASDTTVKHISKRYSSNGNEELAHRRLGILDLVKDGKSRMLAFVAQLNKGKVGSKVLAGLLEFECEKARREGEGKTLAGIQMPEAAGLLLHSLSLLSSKAYNQLRKYLPAPTIRHFQQERSKRINFKLGIDPNNFTRVAESYQHGDPSAPLTLAVDDTMLSPNLSVFWDPVAGCWMLIGQVGDPRAYATEQEVEEVLSLGELQRGKKIRVYYLSTNTPGIPSRILAAFPIAEDETADSLHLQAQPIMDQLSACKLLPRVVSWASDGAKTELSLQKLLLGDYPVLELKIPSQHSHFSTINIQRSLTPGGKPISYLVDEKHTLKNARNAHSSGARLLTTGNGVLLHRDLVDIVARDNSPLLQRDVHRRDHQDDQGAARYASVALLQHVAEETPSHSTLLVYLYIFGELHSAIQSRSLPHLHRLRILLTVRYYLEGWRTFISAHPDYPPHRSFLSSEFITIVFRLIDGYIGLTHTFRDEFPDRPFFPWRHSTEMLEHLFASARTLAPDFDALGFVQAANKLATLMELDIQLDAQSAGLPLPTSSSAKGRAAEGYHHTYNRMDGVDLVNLSTYFTDADLRLAVAEATTDALALLKALKMYSDSPTDISVLSDDPADPSPSAGTLAEPDSDDEAPMDMDVFAFDAATPAGAQLSALLELLQADNSVKPAMLQERIDETALALSALEMERSFEINKQPTDDPERQLEQTRLALRAALLPPGPHINTTAPASEELQPLLISPVDDDCRLDPFALVQRRHLHEDGALQAVLRKAGSGTFISRQQPRSAAESLLSKTTRRLAARIRECFDDTTQLGKCMRDLRWKGSAETGRLETDAERDRRLILMDAFDVACQRVRDERFDLYSTSLNYSIILTGAVTKELPLKRGLFVFAVLGTAKAARIGLCIVLAMYRQEGNKGPHKDVDEAGCLAALSYLALQELNIITNTSASTTISMQHGIAHYHHVKSSRVLLALTELPAARSFPLPADEEVPILPAVRRRYRSLGAAEKTLVGLASGTVEAINKRKAVEDDDFEKALGEVKTGGFTGKGVKKWQPSLSKF